MLWSSRLAHFSSEPLIEAFSNLTVLVLAAKASNATCSRSEITTVVHVSAFYQRDSIRRLEGKDAIPMAFRVNMTTHISALRRVSYASSSNSNDGLRGHLLDETGLREETKANVSDHHICRPMSGDSS